MVRDIGCPSLQRRSVGPVCAHYAVDLDVKTLAAVLAVVGRCGWATFLKRPQHCASSLYQHLCMPSFLQLADIPETLLWLCFAKEYGTSHHSRQPFVSVVSG